MLAAASVILMSFGVLRSTQEWAIDDEGCWTPDGEIGDCTEVYNCQPILHILEGDIKTGYSSPLSEEASNVLERYICGINKGPKVCCPRSGVITTTKTTNQPPKTTPSTTQTPLILHRQNLLPAKCGIFDDEMRIAYGETADLFEFPWMAIIAYQNRRGVTDFRCGGSLINNRYVLTAAHCITNLKSLTLSFVRLGEYNMSSPIDCVNIAENQQQCAEPHQDMEIEEAIPHPEFNRATFVNDIGLIRLKREAKMSESVQPICLPIKAILRKVPKNVVLTGWGNTENATTSDVLLTARLNVIDSAECRVYENLNFTDGHLCVGHSNSTACPGDSGAPAQIFSPIDNDIRYVQYGVLSAGNSCGVNSPSVVSNVLHYLDWIVGSIKP